MPSFRVSMTIGALLPGVHPEMVLPTAADAARRLTTVETVDLSVVAGAPRIVVRFTADDAHMAHDVAGSVVASTSTVAELLKSTITRRDGGRWYALK